MRSHNQQPFATRRSNQEGGGKGDGAAGLVGAQAKRPLRNQPDRWLWLPERAPWWGAIAALSLVMVIPGCSGCWQDSTTQKKKSAAELQEEEEEIAKRKAAGKKKEAKPDFDVGRLNVQPDDSSLATNNVKPGHWASTSQLMKANNFQILAELHTAATTRTGTILDVENTPFRLRLTRPAALPKGQAKHLESLFYVPRHQGRGSKVVWLRSQLLSRNGAELEGTMRPTTSMPNYQQHLVVLSRFPDSYAYLKRLDSIIPPTGDLSVQNDVVFYRVAAPSGLDKQVPLPSNPLTWTNVAFVLWDEVNPNWLTPDQQDAILHWLHWGGQLVVSGPGSMDALKNSFLQPYLPADKLRTVELDSSDFAAFNDHWSLESKKKKQRMTLDIIEGQPLVGVELKLRPEGNYLDGADALVAERRVGQGRIAVTAFSLSARPVLNWGSYDSFFNGGLLRRPPRVFSENDYGEPIVDFHNYSTYATDPRFHTLQRFFTRDVAEGDAKLTGGVAEWRLAGYAVDEQSGVAGWKDTSAASNAARLALKDAAGIEIPKPDFVLKIIAVYLIVLVPVNWLVFRAINRVEWAWIAAPVLAVAASLMVIKLAELEIGFARSRTEASVLELQGSHRYGHLTRYTALYTSLATRYEFMFDNTTAVAQPFTIDPSYERGIRDRVVEATLRRDNRVSLQDFQVRSNDIGLVHSEQMQKLSGPVALTGDSDTNLQVKNDSGQKLRDTAVFRRTADGDLEYAWVGDLESERAAPLRFQAWPDYRVPQWDRSLVMTEVAVKDELSLGRLVRLATRSLPLFPGEVRLVGWTEDAFEGYRIRPAAPQVLTRTLVLAHLRRADLPPARPDLNLKVDVQDAPPVRSDDNLETELFPPES